MRKNVKIQVNDFIYGIWSKEYEGKILVVDIHKNGDAVIRRIGVSSELCLEANEYKEL